MYRQTLGISQYFGQILALLLVLVPSYGMGAELTGESAGTCLSALSANSIQRAELSPTAVSSLASSDSTVKLAMFDVDSTIRVSYSGSPFATDRDDVYILPGVADTIARLKSDGYLVAFFSNQGGGIVNRFGYEAIDGSFQNTIRKIREQNSAAIVDYYDFAESHDEMRKPNIGMYQNLKSQLEKLGAEMRTDDHIFVGDSLYKKNEWDEQGRRGASHNNNDRRFAENIQQHSGILLEIYHPKDFFGWDSEIVSIIESKSAQSQVPLIESALRSKN